MATNVVINNLDLQTAQKTMYYSIRRLQEINRKAGIKVIGLSDLLSMTKSAMTKEDIAWVEQQIKEMLENEE